MKTHIVEIDGPVHYADFGGDGEPVVMVHGLGGSHINWLSIGPRFASAGYRTLAVDLANTNWELTTVLQELENRLINVTSIYPTLAGDQLILTVDKIEEAKPLLPLSEPN